jgi:colicin import membrane protein
VDPDTWTCFDAEGCRALIETRRANNPFLAQLREIKEKTEMAKIEENKAKAEKAEKAKEPTFCLVTGEPTKGGLFKPGMDARYVSMRVAEVVEANFTKKAEAEARATLKKDGVSEKLVAKFDKSLGLAKDKAEKRAAAEAEKKAAKAEKEKATASS